MSAGGQLWSKIRNIDALFEGSGRANIHDRKERMAMDREAMIIHGPSGTRLIT